MDNNDISSLINMLGITNENSPLNNVDIQNILSQIQSNIPNNSDNSDTSHNVISSDLPNDSNNADNPTNFNNRDILDGLNNFINSNNSSKKNLSSIDIETLMKMKSIIEKLNTNNSPNSNLLYSLKPYLRKSKQSKLDQYVNLMKLSQVTDLFKNEKGDFK